MQIDELELASELAHEKLTLHWYDSELWNDTDPDSIVYTDDAQEVFNEYYDYYLTLIEKTKI